MTERAQALEAALIGAGVLAQEVLASRQHVGNYLRQLAQSVLHDLSTEAVQSPPPVGSPTTEPMEREGVWNPNGEVQQPDIPGGIAKDHARAKRPVIAYACLYSKLVAVAREHGYALALHGSMVADCDLIAAPWIAEASSGDDLARALAVAAPGYLILDTYTDRPAGVRKHVIHLGGGPYLDLAVCPQSASVSDDETTPCEHCGKRLTRGAQDIHWTSDDVALCGDCMASLLAVQPPPPAGSPTTEALARKINAWRASGGGWDVGQMAMLIEDLIDQQSTPVEPAGAENAEEAARRTGCVCKCCDHGESSDCGCDCHADGLCAYHPVEPAGASTSKAQTLADLAEQIRFAANYPKSVKQGDYARWHQVLTDALR